MNDRADNDLLEYLTGIGLIEGIMKTESGIAFPIDGFTGRTMVNLVNTLAAKGPMINKALVTPSGVGSPNETQGWFSVLTFGL